MEDVARRETKSGRDGKGSDGFRVVSLTHADGRAGEPEPRGDQYLNSLYDPSRLMSVPS